MNDGFVVIRMFTFLNEAIRRPNEIGAVSPCTPQAIRRGLSVLDLERAKVIVECGCGTGVFTRHILKRLRPDQVFFALEINRRFVKVARLKAPGATIYNDSVSNLPTYLAKHGVSHSDCIISTLPWASFNPYRQQELLDNIHANLGPDGEFLTIAYNVGTYSKKGRRFKKHIHDLFRDVTKTPTVWRNLPPAFFYHARK